MHFSFDYNSQLARKSRLYVKVSKEVRVITSALAVLVIVIGLGVWLYGPNLLGALIMAIGWIVMVPLIWFHYDIARLSPRLTPQMETVVLEEALPPLIVGQLKSIESPYSVWEGMKGSWFQAMFCVRFRIHPDTFEHLPKDANSQVVNTILANAASMSLNQEVHQLSPVAVMIALLQSYPNYKDILAQLKVDEADLIGGVRWLHNHRDAIDEVDKKNKMGGVARDWTSGFTPTLNRMSFKISDFIESGGLAHQHVGSHKKTIDAMIQDLLKPRANVLLLGEVGAGKSMSVNGFAKRILQDRDLPEGIRYHRVYQVSASAIISSSVDQNAVESTLYSIVIEANKAKNAILFFDNAFNFFTSGNGATDLSRALLEIVKNSSVPLILEMTPVEWQQISAQHSELAGVVNVLHVPEADEASTLDVLEDHCLEFEARSGVIYTYKALKECILMADRYVEGLVFPGKGISLLESAVSHAEGTLVTEKSVQMAIEATYGVKVQVADASEGKELLNLEDQIHQRMVNQFRAVKVVSDALRRARSGVSNPNKPIGTFLFLGPTGVGKTELAKAVAEKYFGKESDIIRVDMNEYTQSADLARLLDRSASTSLLSAVGRNRFTVVLFDEIEKAHPEVVNAFLQLLDEGQMRDEANKVVSFRDTIVISTSNAGADKIRAYIDQGKEVEEFEQQFVGELIESGLFKPEFLNRFDETVVFRPLKPEELLQVTDLLLASVNATLAKQKISVALSDEAKQWLVQKGNDPRLGARPLKRMVQRTVENIISKKVLSGEVKAGDMITLNTVDLESEQTN